MDNGRLTNQGTLFSRCPLSGPFRSMIEPQHQNSRSSAIKRINTLRSCSYRSTVHSPADVRPDSVTIQKIEDQSGSSDLMQRWENGPGYIFLASPDEQEELASYLKDREAEGVKSVHFYFPNDLDASKQTINHMVVDVAGFSSGVAAFTSRCEQAQ